MKRKQFRYGFDSICSFTKSITVSPPASPIATSLIGWLEFEVYQPLKVVSYQILFI